MNINYIMIAIFIIAIIFLFGIVIQFIYILNTPTHKLTEDDYLRKNYWYKFLKFKK